MRKCGCHSHNSFVRLSEDEAITRVHQLALRGLTGAPEDVILDIEGSVSALVEVEDHWDYDIIDEQYRRFHNGS